jgi:hypothetical protein
MRSFLNGIIQRSGISATRIRVGLQAQRRPPSPVSGSLGALAASMAIEPEQLTSPGMADERSQGHSR